jgi:hypothetical protein
MRTVEAMLFALLEPRYNQPDITAPPKVLNMMRPAVGRHFGLTVGELRTSRAQAVQWMMESVTQIEGDIPSQPVCEIQELLPGGWVASELCDGAVCRLWRFTSCSVNRVNNTAAISTRD